MNKLYMTTLVALLSMVLVFSGAYAAGAMGKGNFSLFNSTDLVGVSVKNPQGRFLGLIDEVLVDSTGHAFAIVNHGDYDLYGQGGVNTPVPLQAFNILQTKGGQEVAILNTDVEHIDFAPYLNPLKMNDRQYEAQIYEYFGIQPYWMASSCS